MVAEIDRKLAIIVVKLNLAQGNFTVMDE